MHSQLKSDIAESFVAFKLLEAGLEVFVPRNSQSKTDLIVKSKSGNITKVQIKSSNSIKNGAISFTLVKNNIRYNNGSYREYYTRKDVDVFICVNIVDMEIYLIPFREKATGANVRLKPSESGQIEGLIFREKCLINYDLFETGFENFIVKEEITPKKTAVGVMGRIGKSGFLGVVVAPKHKKRKWVCNLQLQDKKKIYIGSGDNAEELARLHDAKAIELFGSNAITNKSLGLLN